VVEPWKLNAGDRVATEYGACLEAFLPLDNWFSFKED